MESVLIVITLGSLAMTIALALLLARLVRAERQRSDARVAMLRDLADDTAREQAERMNPADDWDRGELVTDDIADYDPADRIGSRPSADLFVRPQARSAWPKRILVAATIALVAGLGAFTLRTTSTSGVPGFVAGGTQQTASTQTPGLLELVSLKQTQDAGALTITGLVQNPRDGAVLSKVRATALAFGADGSFLASGGAPLDFTMLRPGDESGFVISVPVTSPVARYRVGFRSEDGHVIGHVDRRTAATMAKSTDTGARKLRGAS
jgi:hypothetical protein